MSGVFGWPIYFAGIPALFYVVVLLAAPRKWLFSLVLLIYGIAMIFIADEVRAEYGSSNVAYAILDASAGMAIALIILLPLVEGVLRLGTIPFLHDGRARSKIADAGYWFAAGLSIPLVLLYWRVFARYSGTVLIPALLATAIVAFTVFFAMRRRGLSGNPLLLFPGYALGVPIMLAVSLFYGTKVSSAASALAQGAPYCVLSGSANADSILDMTPLTLMSRGISEYHAELVVEATPKTLVYNWSWQNLSFAPIPPDKMHSDTCMRP